MANYPQDQGWKRHAQLAHAALTAERFRGLLRWLGDYWEDEQTRIEDELSTRRSLFSDWLCALAQGFHDAAREGLRLPELVARRTGLASLGELLSSGAAGDIADLEARLWVAWLWARGADESTKPSALATEAKRMGYKSTLTLKTLLGDAADARVALRSEFPKLWPVAPAAGPSTPEERPADVPLLMLEPVPVHGILGRDRKLVELRTLLSANALFPASARTIVLRGMGGVGKTTLAVALARDPVIAHQFPDGVVWTALGPRPNVRALQHRWGRALKVDLTLESDPGACRDVLRSSLERRRMLFVVDDVWDPLPAQGFLVAGEHSAVVFTTRDLATASALATPERSVLLDVLDEASALELLRRLLPSNVTLSEQDAQKLTKKLERLPLAIVLAGRFLANQAYVPGHFARMMGELLERPEARLHGLRDERGRLGLTETEPVSVHAILGMSVERLEATDRERFAMVSLFGGDPLTWDIATAAATWDCSVEAAEATTSRLIQRGLVEPRGDRYWMHALLADYAAELLGQDGEGS